MLCVVLFGFLATVEFLERLEFLDECLVLVLEHGDAVLQTLDVLLLLTAALARRLAVLQQPQLPFLDRRLRLVPLVTVVATATTVVGATHTNKTFIMLCLENVSNGTKSPDF